LLDAAERLLTDEGYAAVTTRRVAEAAGVNHGLVHYYFGSMEELFVQVLERFTARLIERQRDMYSKEVPFIDKWRSAMDYLEADLEAGYPKIWLELQALAWNRPELRARVASVNARWRHVLTEAFEQAIEVYGLTDSLPVDAVVSLVMTFNQGIMLERLSGVTTGQTDLLTFIDRTLKSFEARKAVAG
jgi:AcrR family transcriptional regulator